MPTDQKVAAVENMKEWMGECSIAISTNFSGLDVDEMTDLRSVLRENDVYFRVIKNTLAHMAAEAAGRPALKEIITGPTGIAFSYGDVQNPAKVLMEFIRTRRSILSINGGVMGEKLLSSDDIRQLAIIPSRDELLARLAGQLQGQIVGLAYVLNGPISGLARVLQRHIEDVE